MKKSKFFEEQIAHALSEVAGGRTAIRESTFTTALWIGETSHTRRSARDRASGTDGTAARLRSASVFRWLNRLNLNVSACAR